MWRVLVLGAGLAILSGCAKPETVKTYPVTGKVVDAKGVALPSGTVSFTSRQASDTSSTAQIQPDGTFSMETYKNKTKVSGVPEGEYQVTIIQFITDGNNPPPPVTLPKPYRVEPRENHFEFRLGK